MKYKTLIKFALILVLLVISFFNGNEIGYIQAKEKYSNDLAVMETAYKTTVINIRKAHEESVKKLKKYYYDRLKDIDTACPKEDISFFDHELIAFWAKMYNKYNFIYIPKGVFNNPATHFTEEDEDRLSGALDKLEKE